MAKLPQADVDNRIKAIAKMAKDATTSEDFYAVRDALTVMAEEIAAFWVELTVAP